MCRCRLCGQPLFEKPLLTLENMPKAAQYLPDLSNPDVGIQLDICQCSCCGLVQLSSSPVDYYREVIRAVGYSSEMLSFRKRQFFEFIKRYGCKKVLEIGCGTGDFLEIMQKYCTNSFGIEYSDNGIAACQKKNLTVAKLYLDSEDVIIPNSPFDGFYILSFLEHIPNLVTFLAGLRKNLSENAVGIIEVPNFDMMIKHNLFAEFIPDHLYYFTQKSLAFTLNYCGFEVLDISEVWHNYIISAVVRKRVPLSLTGFKDAHSTLKANIKAYIDKFSSVAVWGAGHQAFALLSLLKLDDKITYIVDAAEFKQNKVSPATHIPIVSPDYFRDNEPQAIIVMAGSYSEEIIENILRDRNMNIAKLEGSNFIVVNEV